MHSNHRAGDQKAEGAPTQIQSTGNYSFRAYRAEDRAALEALRDRHSGDGRAYWFADPDDGINVGTLVAEVDGKIVAALTGRATLEAFLMVDPTHGTAAERWQLLQELFDRGSKIADSMGYREIHIGVPLWLRGYFRRLLKLPFIYFDGRFRAILSVWEKFHGGE